MTEQELICDKINRYYRQPYTPKFKIDALIWSRDLSNRDEIPISHEEFLELRERLKLLSNS